MPFISVKVIEGVVDASQRRKIVERPIAGRTLTTADVKTLAGGPRAESLSARLEEERA